jgi:hypothetical protein
MRHTKETEIMKKLLISTAIAIVAITGSAFARSEIPVTSAVWEVSDFPVLAAKVKAVCEGKASLSDQLKAACKTGTFPNVTKAGAFRNTGIGAELVILMRQQADTRRCKSILC